MISGTIDYILTFPSEKDAINFFYKYNNALINKDNELSSVVALDENKNYIWNGSIAIPNLEIMNKSETYDKDGNIATPKVTRTGFYVWLTLSKLYDELIKISLCYGNIQLTNKLANNFIISPQPMGRNYSWDKV